MKLYAVLAVTIFTVLALGMKFTSQPVDPAAEVAKLVYLDYEVGVSQCWKDINGYKSFFCEMDFDHPQLGKDWCFTVEKWDGEKPTEVLLSRSGYDCDFASLTDY